MANTYKNIVITPNITTVANVVPVIQFSGGDATLNTDINLRVYTTQGGTLSFEGSAGQLFSITNDLTNSIFSVNDVSGIPSIEVNANGLIKFGEFGGNIAIGRSDANYKVDVFGTINASNVLINGAAISGTSTTNLTPVFTQANIAYNQANTSYDQANTARVHANAAFTQANTAYNQANTVFTQANVAYNQANTSFDQANTARVHANAAFTQANTARVHANTAHITANAAFDKANAALPSTGGTINGNLNIVGNLTMSGNTSLINVSTYVVNDPLIYLAGNNYSSDIVDIGFVANYVNTTGSNVHTGVFRDASTKEYYVFEGYDKEPDNNVIDPSGNGFTISVLNATLRTSNIILGGTNAISWIRASYDQANTAYNQVNTSFIQANSAFAKANTANITADLAYNQANTSYNQSNAAYNQVNTAFIQANSAFDQANTARVHANAAFTQANTAYNQANTSFDQANTARTHANSAHITANAGFDQANTARVHANAAFTQANIAYNQANAGFTQANTVFGSSNLAFAKANTANITADLAFGKANAALANTTGTFNGTLTINNDLIVLGAANATTNLIVKRIIAASNGTLGTVGQVLTSNATGDIYWSTPSAGASSSNPNAAIGYTITGGGSTILTGVAGVGISVPFNANIQSVTVHSDVTGSIVIDIWKAPYANYPPTVSNSICASAKPNISSNNRYTDSTLTGWTRTINADDILYFNVDSVTSMTGVVLTLKVIKT